MADSWPWYKEVFGFDLKMFGDEGVAERMLPYTGGKPQPRYAILVLNLRGGGGFEVWEPRGRELNYIKFTPEFGDYGIFACKVKSRDVRAAYEEMKKKGVNILTTPCANPAGKEHFFVMDPWNNIFDVESDDYCFLDEDKNTGGNNGATLGVSDMDKSVKFYSSIMDYDKVEYDVTMVAVLMDENGVIVDCVIDSLGTSVVFDAAGAVTTDLTAAIQTKSLSADTFRKNGYAMKREGFFGMDSICSGIFKVQSQHC